MLPKIIFCGTVQNCAQYLSESLKNIEEMAEKASESAYIFVENDSTDNSKKILREWGASRSNFHLVNLDGLNTIPVRTLRLEIARNSYISTIKFYENLKKFDYMVVIDMDDDGIYPINAEEFLSTIKFLEASENRAAGFANQKGIYCDMWALRDRDRCPGDVWEEVADYVVQNKCTDEDAFSKTFAARIFSIKETEGPISVDSAFGGLGIYKMNYVLGNQNPYLGYKMKIITLTPGELNYSRWQVCEHVHFHAGIKSQGGEIFIIPSLINRESSEIIFPPSGFRGMLF